MKLELNKFKLKQVLLSAFVLLISFGAAATATFAWFTVNRNAQIGGSNISFSTSGLSGMDITYYEIFDLKSTTVDDVVYDNYYFNYTDGISISYENGETTSSTRIDMPTYSLVESKYQLLLKINFTSVSGISVSSKSTSSFKELYSPDAGGSQLKASGNSLSSVIEFAFFTESEIGEVITDYSISDGDNITTKDVLLAKIPTNNRSDKFKSFVSLDTGTGVVSTTNELSCFSTSESIETVYILLNYYKDAIDYIYSLNLDNEVIQSEDENFTIGFTCDFSYIFS